MAGLFITFGVISILSLMLFLWRKYFSHKYSIRTADFRKYLLGGQDLTRADRTAKFTKHSKSIPPSLTSTEHF